MQRAPYRSFQRPDADHLSLDSARTSIGGSYGAFSLAKTAGDRLIASVTYEQTSPGFEANDLGFQVRGDLRSVSTAVQYRNPTLSSWAREWSASLYSTISDNFGGDRIEERVSWFGNVTLLNFWELGTFGSLSPQVINDRLLRGGPLAQRPTAFRQQFSIESDYRKPLSVSVDALVGSDASGFRSRNIGLSVEWRPLSQARLRLGPSVQSAHSTDQYIDAIADPLATMTYGRRYVFANVRQREVRLDTRIDWTFSPWLSLQVFLQPFASAGEFTRFKEFTTPRRFAFAEYGVDAGTIANTPNGFVVDPDGAGRAQPFAVATQDFTVRALRGNAVLRWEYSPGSSLFLVWSQQREQALDDAQFDVGRQLGRAFADPGQHVFLIKFSRWIGR